MTEANTLYLARGVLTVNACGYWFSGGGEKGPFGFYPHLKQHRNGKDLPVYPDTQLKGDLRMAANWIAGLSPSGKDSALFPKVFGQGGQTQSARLRVTDLELDKQSCQQWKQARFQVKPRTEIEDNLRTNKAHMLAQLEMAYLDGLSLHAELYLGYFKDENTLKQAQEMVSQAAAFLSGAGAFRSRGYGRGDVMVSWQNTQSFAYPAAPVNETDTTVRCFIRPTVNFRNKPVEPGQTQLLTSVKYIDVDQLRGAFVRAYCNLFGAWPAHADMATLTFSPFYPALQVDGAHAWPGVLPPASTLRFEDGEIQDMRGVRPPVDNDPKNINQQENEVHQKTKPAPVNVFLTDETDPRWFALPSHVRMRNAMADNFVTIDDGLFAQELIPRGQLLFGGAVQIDAPNTSFGRQAVWILKNLWLDMQGTLFEPQNMTVPTDSPGAAGGTALLVTQPIDAGLDLIGKKGNQITLGALRRFRKALGRPRRNRLVFMPGSILEIRRVDEPGCRTWQGFNPEGQNGKVILHAKPKASQTSMEHKNDRSVKPDCSVRLKKLKDDKDCDLTKMSRAQAGILRMLHDMSDKQTEAAFALVENLKTKYDKWDKKTISQKLIPKQIILELADMKKANNQDEFKSYLWQILQMHTDELWQQEAKKAKEALEKAWKEASTCQSSK